MAKYVYPVVLIPAENNGYIVSFPDLGGCRSQGSDLADALEMAKDALCLMLYDMEESNAEIPLPSAINDISADDNCIVSLVTCDTLEYRKFFDSKAVKKTLTIPSWLNTLSERAGINFSAVLQNALKKELDIDT